MTDAGFLEAKSYLLEAQGDQKISLYDHLSEVLLKVLEHKPKNVLQTFENISRDVKRDRLTTASDQGIKSANHDAPLLSVAKRQIKLFESAEKEEEIPTETSTPVVPNIVKEQQIFEQCGVSVGREETVLLQFSIQKLAKTVGSSVISLRFWGKILGTNNDYYVVEGTLADGVEDVDGADEEEESQPNGGPAVGASNEEAEDPEMTALSDLDDTPKPHFKKQPAIPTETNTGANKHWYWVCNDPSKPWTKLPAVKPHHIVTARKIKKVFSGNLAQAVHSYPPFNGNEGNLLRAQIARISAATQISPVGYFTFPEEEPEDDDGAQTIETVQDFEGVAMEELGKTAAWAHHSSALLPQGRCLWYSVQQEKDENDDEDHEEEVEEALDEEEPETASPLLTVVTEDTPNDSEYGAAWSAKTFPSYAPEVACMSSNNWPGAYGVAADRGTYFRNIYVGWGMKHSPQAFVPLAIQTVESEYDAPLECAQDPSAEEEQALEEEREDKEGADLEDDDGDGSGDDED